MTAEKSLKDILLVHELAFILLICLAGASGGYGIHMWDKASHESQRISLLVQEIQQTRGDLYRQMKELFDGYFLFDQTAEHEYQGYTHSIHGHFETLDTLVAGPEEKQAIEELKESYQAFIDETSPVFKSHQTYNLDAYNIQSIEKTLNSKLESLIFHRYELVSTRAEKVLAVKQAELQERLDEAKRISLLVLGIPILLATLLLILSRVFLQKSIVKPIARLVHATTEISAGNLSHNAPIEGAEEIATLSSAINHMAQALAESQEALIQTEKQAAMGLLVPMLAHNIRNPLASIRATAQVANTQQLDADTRESLNDIMSAVDRLERWTGSLLAYLHPLKPQPSKTTLRKIIEEATIPLHVKLRQKNIQLELPAWENQDDTLYTDEHLLEQALYNLLLNAVEAVPSHTCIELLVDITDASVNLLIADRGPGMPFKPDPHAASPGPSTKRFGTGLGIPFAFKVCEALNGSIQFGAREGGGTLIHIELPRTHLKN